jgi:hypothetical protein
MSSSHNSSSSTSTSSSSSSNFFTLKPIAIVHSPYKERFGIPRQPQLAPGVEATVELLSPYARADALSGLERTVRTSGCSLSSTNPHKTVEAQLR